jgi:ssDNA-binding Zn-finger/Zn-ribbon topoisomerase 1
MTDRMPEIDGYFACFMNGCDGRLVLRHGRRFGAFYGCTRYPTCHATLSVEHVREMYAAEVIGDVSDDESDLVRWDR